MVQWNTISLPFGAGVDTKTDPKMLAPPKLVILQDCIFTNAKRLTKRNGYTDFTNNMIGGDVWSSPTMVRSYRDELTLAATSSHGPRLLSYSETLELWQDKGQYASVEVSKQIVNTSNFVSGSNFPYATCNSSSVIAGNIALFSFDTGITGVEQYGYADASNTTSITVVDLETGTHIADSLPIPNALGFSKSVLLGSSTLAVFYITSTTINHLAFRIITVSGLGVVIGSEVIVGACAALSDLSFQFPYSYDWCNTPGGAVIAVANEPNLNLYTVTTGGAVSAPTTIMSSGDITALSCSSLSNSNVWIYWVSDGSNLRYAIYSSSLSVVLASTSIETGLSNVHQISASIDSTTQQTVYFSTYVNPSIPVTGGIYPTINVAIVNSAGIIVSTAEVYLFGFDVYGKCFSVNSRAYMPIVSFSYGAGATGFILDLENSLPVTKFLQTEAEGLYKSGYTSGSSTIPPEVNGIRFPGFLTYPILRSNTQVFLGAGFVNGTNPVIVTQPTNGNAGPSETAGSVYLGTCMLTFDFDSIDSYQGLIQQDTLVLNGGVISMYDGANVCELGFNVDPDNLALSPSTSGGFMGAGTYDYFITYEWTDANGNLYSSAPSPSVQAFFGSGSSNAVTGTFSLCFLTQKQNVTIKIWRNSGGGVPRLTLTLPNSIITPGLTYGVFTDVASDSEIENNEALYTQNGAILENLSPPPSMILWTNNNRLWAIDSESNETTIEYSKTASRGSGIAFSTGQLEVVIDSKYGKINGASAMDEKTVILKENGAGYFIGDGANDAGSGSSITNFQFIPSDTGCSNSKSVILYPDGILFRSSNDKGIYVVSRGVQVEYFGYDISRYSAQDIQSALITASRNQIRFLTSSGDSLLYDYVMKQWSTFTNHEGLSSDIWNGTYVYVREDGSLYQEDVNGGYLDNGISFAPLILTSWLKAGSIQGYQRTRRIELLGNFQKANNGHAISVQVAYDFDPTFSAPVEYVFTGIDGVFQYRERLARQKCDTFQIMISEIVTGASGEYIDFSDLGLEIGIKSGLNKLPGTKSVG